MDHWYAGLLKTSSVFLVSALNHYFPLLGSLENKSWRGSEPFKCDTYQKAIAITATNHIWQYLHCRCRWIYMQDRRPLEFCVHMCMCVCVQKEREEDWQIWIGEWQIERHWVSQLASHYLSCGSSSMQCVSPCSPPWASKLEWVIEKISPGSPAREQIFSSA